MGVRLLFDRSADGGLTEAACLYDSVTMTAFGPVVQGDEAEEYRDWFDQYPRSLDEGVDLRSLERVEIERRFRAWLALPKCDQCDKRDESVKSRTREVTLSDPERDVMVDAGVLCDECADDLGCEEDEPPRPPDRTTVADLHREGRV